MKKNIVWLVILLCMSPTFVLISITHQEALNIFELQEPVTADMVKKQYKKLAMKWHPDKFVDEAQKKDAEEKFKNIGAAYQFFEKEFAAEQQSYSEFESEKKQMQKWFDDLSNLVERLLQRTAVLKNNALRAEVKDSERWLFEVKQAGKITQEQYDDQMQKLRDIESKISGKENAQNGQQQTTPESTAQQKQSVKAYTSFQEALDAVVMGYPFNKQSITQQDALAWADVIASLKAYIKNINTGRGILEKVSAKNIALFEKALQQISLATSLLIAAKLGKLADKEKQLKAISENLRALQIELKPVTTGLLKDFEITQQVKELLGMLAAKFEQSAKNA